MTDNLDIDSSSVIDINATEDWTQADDFLAMPNRLHVTQSSHELPGQHILQENSNSAYAFMQTTQNYVPNALLGSLQQKTLNEGSGDIRLGTQRNLRSEKNRREPPLNMLRRDTAVTTNIAMGVTTTAVARTVVAESGIGNVPRSQERDVINQSVLMFRSPLSIATVVVRGVSFSIHADLLCRESDYFSRALHGGFTEAETQKIELDGDDVSPEDFGLWIDLLYRLHFHRPGTFMLRKEETGGSLSTRQILTLWRISDRFLHQPLANLAEESLQHRLGLYSVEQWRKLYRTRPASDIRSRVSRLQDAYRQCTEQGLPFSDFVITACANCPAQVYADCVDLLDQEFMAQVSRRMILAHADSTLLSKDERTAITATSTSTGSVAAAERGIR